jgi:predicted deacylase
MSTKPMTVGEITAAPGQVARGFLTTDVGRGVTVRMPVVVINGMADGPVFAVTAGVHGAEYPGIEAAIRLSRTLNPAEVRGAAIVVPLVSVPAFQRRAIYVNPLDGINFNRVCPGNPAGTITEIMAHLLFKNVIAQADYYIDLHGGDMIEALVPFTLYYKSGNEKVDDASRALAEAYGIPIILGTTALRGGSYGAAAAMGKPAILTEAGGQGILDEPSTQTHVTGVLNALRKFGCLPGTPAARVLPEGHGGAAGEGRGPHRRVHRPVRRQDRRSAFARDRSGAFPGDLAGHQQERSPDGDRRVAAPRHATRRKGGGGRSLHLLCDRGNGRRRSVAPYRPLLLRFSVSSSSFLPFPSTFVVAFPVLRSGLASWIVTVHLIFPAAVGT